MLTPTRVLVANPHAPTRRLIGDMLAAGTTGFTVAAEAATLDDVLDLLGSAQPQVFVIDTALPGGGIEAARAITDRHASAPVVLTTLLESTEELREGIMAGAVGYLTTPIDQPVLVDALRAVMRGRVVVPRHLAPALRGDRRNDFGDRR